jgi:hypothetical protein
MTGSVNTRRVAIILAAAVVSIAGAFLAIRWLPPQLGGYVEERLARETGLRWRIGTLALDLSRGLVLRDVTVGGADGLDGHVGTVVVAPSIPVLLGGGGAVRTEIEAARLTLPLDRPTSAGTPDARRSGAANLSKVQAVVRAAGLAPIDRGRALALSAGRIDASLHLAATTAQPGPEAGPDVSLDLPELGLAIAVAAGAPDTPRILTATLKPRDGPDVSATAPILRDGSSLRLDPIRGTVDQAVFTGRLVTDIAGAKPRVDATFKLDALTLTTPGTAPRAGPGDGITVPLEILRVPDLAWLAGFEGRLGVSIQRLAVGPIRASAAVLAARTRDGQLDIALDGATLYGGTARGRYVLAGAERAMRHEVGLTLAGLRTKPLLEAVGASGVDGAGGARIDIGAQGVTRREILASAAGRAEVAVTEGRIDGLDLARAAGLARLGGGLSSRLDQLGAQFTIGEGHATTDDLRLKTSLIDAKGTGVFDLMNGTMDVRLKPITVAAGGRLDVPIRIAGPWGSPAVDADLSGLAQDPAALMEGLTNLGTGLLGGDGARSRHPEVRPDGRDRGGPVPRGGAERRNGIEDFLEGLMGGRDNARSRP